MAGSSIAQKLCPFLFYKVVCDKLKTQSIDVNHIFFFILGTYIMLIYVQVFIFQTSLVLMAYFMLKRTLNEITGQNLHWNSKLTHHVHNCEYCTLLLYFIILLCNTKKKNIYIICLEEAARVVNHQLMWADFRSGHVHTYKSWA